MRKTTITVGALGALMAGAPAAEAARPLELAVQDDPAVLSPSPATRDLALRRAAELRASWLRINVPWAWTPSSHSPYATFRPKGPIVYDFSKYDAAIDRAARWRMRVQLTLMGPAPAWANRNHGKVGGVRPDARAYGEFARQAAAHFRGRVKRYSIWNEPNLSFWLSPQTVRVGRSTRYEAAGIYRDMYTAAYAQIKATDGGARVLIGETAAYPSSRKWSGLQPLTFLRAVACRDLRMRPTRRCPQLRADGYAHHAYGSGNPYSRRAAPGAVTIGTLSRLTSTLASLSRVGAVRTSNGRATPDVYVTEFGYHAVRDPSWLRARRLPEALSVAQRTPRVRQLLQYMLLPPRGGDEWNTSLLTRSGRPTTPFVALRSAAIRGVRTRSLVAPAPFRLPPAP
jgi:hypothetical protein